MVFAFLGVKCGVCFSLCLCLESYLLLFRFQGSLLFLSPDLRFSWFFLSFLVSLVCVLYNISVFFCINYP